MPFEEEYDIPYGQVSFDKVALKSLVLQLITGSIIISNDSKIDITKWAKSMPALYEKRFGKGKVGMNNFKIWAETYAEYLTWYITDEKLEELGFDNTEICAICAHDMIEELTKLPENDYIKGILMHSKVFNIMTTSEIENRVAEYERALEEAIEESNSVEGYENALQSPDNESPLTEEEQDILDQAVEDAHQEIPTNSATLLVDEATSRFSSAIWYENIQKKAVILAGVGGIGSYVGFLLARMKPTAMFIYDDDIVETVNMSGQLYGQSDLGRPKVSALAEMIRNYAGYSSVFAISERFTDESEASDIMICGFDNMAARRLFFNKWVNHVQSKPEEERKDCLFIDGRLTAEEFQVLCIRGDDEYNINRYNNEFLFSDAEADETICSYKQTTFCANMIASYMVNLFVNFCANQCEPLIDRDLPFLITYNAETMYLKTEV